MRLHLHEWGDPGLPVLLCLHGVQAHGGRFRRLAEERLAARFRVVAPDLRGHGRSPWDPPWSLAAHVADVEPLAETLRPAACVGHSFGGRLVLELAARRPELVPRAVLLDPALHVTPGVASRLAEEELARRPYASRDEALELRSRDAPRAPRAFLEEELDAHLTDELRFRYSRAAAVTMFGEIAAPRPPAPACPTLLVAAEATEVTTQADADALRAALGGRLVEATVPGGHIVLWDAYAETADAIDAFLDGPGD